MTTGEIEKLVYQEYLELKSSDFQEKIRYYERNNSEIKQLPFRLSTQIQCECVMAYFEVGAYYKYLDQADELIQLVIEENIFKIKNKNIFEELLFRKAAASFNVMEYEKSEYLFSELLKINPSKAVYKTAYSKCNIDKLRHEGQNYRAVTILLFIITGILIGVELLCIRPFHEQYITLIEISRNVLFAFAFLSFVYQEARIRFLTNRTIQKLTNK